MKAQEILKGIASNEIRMARIKNIRANTKGSKTVQHNDISWSKRIRGKDALTHTKVKASIQVLIPSDAPDKTPSKKGMFNCLITHS